MINCLILLVCVVGGCWLGCKLGLDKPTIWQEFQLEMFKAKIAILEEEKKNKNRPIGV